MLSLFTWNKHLFQPRRGHLMRSPIRGHLEPEPRYKHPAALKGVLCLSRCCCHGLKALKITRSKNTIIQSQLKTSSFRSFHHNMLDTSIRMCIVHYLIFRTNAHLKWIRISIKLEVSPRITPNVSRYSSIRVQSAHNEADFSQGTLFPAFFLPAPHPSE